MDYIKKNSNKIDIYSSSKKAILKADVLFSDKVISINDKVNKTKKMRSFKKFRLSNSINIKKRQLRYNFKRKTNYKKFR